MSLSAHNSQSQVVCGGAEIIRPRKYTCGTFDSKGTDTTSSSASNFHWRHRGIMEYTHASKIRVGANSDKVNHHKQTTVTR
jgi:hypothetical protein